MPIFFRILVILVTVFISVIMVVDLSGVYRDPGAYPFGSEIGYLYSSKEVYVCYHIIQLGVNLILIILGFTRKRIAFLVALFVALIMLLYPMFSVNV